MDVNSIEENNSFYYEIPKFRNRISNYGLVRMAYHKLDIQRQSASAS
jgi:hypothetical protein